MPGLPSKTSESLAVGSGVRALVEVQFAVVPRLVMAPNLPLAPTQTKVVMPGSPVCIQPHIAISSSYRYRHIYCGKIPIVNRFLGKMNTTSRELGLGQWGALMAARFRLPVQNSENFAPGSCTSETRSTPSANDTTVAASQASTSR